MILKFSHSNLSQSLKLHKILRLSHKRVLFIIFTLLFLLATNACQKPPGTQVASTRSRPTATIPVPSPTSPPKTLPPTPLLTTTESTPKPIEQNLPISTTPASDPVKFVFPSQAPPPVSAWRPPLYPTPWALTPYDHFYFARPIGADQINWPLADYRYGGVFIEDVVHSGIDIPAHKGTPVLAAGSGKVTWAGYGLYYYNVNDLDDPYGKAVSIKHNFGYQGETLYTIYGHLDRIDVIEGQIVNTGDMIGIVGETGHATGPHLHFEVRVRKNNYFGSRNPELWLVPPQGWGILAARIMTTNGNSLENHLVIIESKESGQSWSVKTYGEGRLNSDTYYNENMVIGDLPSGDYIIWIKYAGFSYNLDIHLLPGFVNYFTFKGRSGFSVEPPPEPQSIINSPE